MLFGLPEIFATALTVAAFALITTRVNGPGNIIRIFRRLVKIKVFTCPLCCSFWTCVFVACVWWYLGGYPIRSVLDFLRWVALVLELAGATWLVMSLIGSPIAWEE